MIFETLYESALKEELILIDGGYCRWHMRKDHIIVIYEIISTRHGAGSEMLEKLKTNNVPILAKCPSDLESNAWYEKKGFINTDQEITKSGRVLNIWIYGDDKNITKPNANRANQNTNTDTVQQRMSDFW